jgi:hypothetical protein
MPAESRLLNFEGLHQPVKLSDCNELIPHLPVVFPGWEITAAPKTAIDPVLTLYRADDGYRLEGYWIDATLRRRDEVDALCALAAEVMRAYGRQDDRLLCLHGAAAEFGGRLVVFPNQYRAGKSILSAVLAACGSRLYCDDILPIDLADGEGIAPGLAPRLRLPLPHNLAPESRRFIDSRVVLRGTNYAYLELDRDAMAERGEQAPPGAFVLLERQEGAVAALEPIGEAELLAQVIWQNFAREAEAPVILDALNRLVSGAQRFRLRYERAEDAAALLQREFATWPETAAGEPAKSARPAGVAANDDEIPAGCYRQAPGIEVIEVDGDSFLADRDGAAIHRLNAVGSAIWGLLREPIAADEIVDLLLQAFPGLDAGQVEKDVGELLEQLRRKHLLQFRG